MSAHETRMVRVATMKDSGKRYLFNSFHGTRGLLFSELASFKGLRSEHPGGVRWVSDALFTVKEEPKTAALCMSLLKQAAQAEGLAVQIVKGGARLARLNDEGDEVSAAVREVTRVVASLPRLSKSERRTVMGRFLKVD